MSNNFLLGIIGVLLVTATGVGVVGATSNPQFASEASSKVSDIADGVLTQVQTTAQKFGLRDSDNTAELQSSTTIQHEDSNKSDDDSDMAINKPKATTPVVSKKSSDRVGEREHEDEDGDDQDDDSRSSTPVQRAPGQPAPTPVVTPPTQSTGTTFTMAQVAAHSTATSCYTTIGGMVYDLTPFITQHPGGKSTISRLCGIEGTAEFNAQHGGQGNPAAELASLKIGTLAQ